MIKSTLCQKNKVPIEKKKKTADIDRTQSSSGFSWCFFLVANVGGAHEPGGRKTLATSQRWRVFFFFSVASRLEHTIGKIGERVDEFSQVQRQGIVFFAETD